MPIPEYVAKMRSKIGHDLLWLPGVTAVILKEVSDRPGDVPLVLLVRRSDTGAYTPVTGIVDPFEHPVETAVRETMEETGVVAVVERLVALRVTPAITSPNGDVSGYLDSAFRCHWVSGEPIVGDDESTEAAWWPADALPDMEPRHLEAIRVAIANPRDVLLG